MLKLKKEQPGFVGQHDAFERTEGKGGPASLHRLRRAALDSFTALGFPGDRNEDWKFTNVTPLTRVPFELGSKAILPGDVSLPDGIRLVFINGWFAPELSNAGELRDGIIVRNLADVFNNSPALVEPNLAQHADYEDHAFTALNTAFLREGAFIQAPAGKVAAEPIHLLYVSTADKPIVSHPRNLIVVGDNSQATIVEHYSGKGDAACFTNAVTEVILGEGAGVDHYKVQDEATLASHIARLQIHQQRNSRFSTHYIGIGGNLVRNEVHVELAGEGCEATVNGLYMASGNQHMDNFTVIDHAQPHCASHELYKGVLDGKAHGVFNGKIFVRQDAQKTDAKQTNQTLLLSVDATINTKPQLEIFADDVKCTHGATVGQLDETSLFYLRSRGIGLDAARSLLTYAFANDIIGRIKVESVRASLEARLLEAQHLPRNDWAEETP